MKRTPKLTGAVFILVFIIVLIFYAAQGNGRDNITADIPSQTAKMVAPSETYSFTSLKPVLSSEPSVKPALTYTADLITSKPDATHLAEVKPETTTPESQRTQEPTESVTPSKEITLTVYITETGEKYHKSGCQYLSHSCIPISLDEAKESGYTRCSRCHPPK